MIRFRTLLAIACVALAAFAGTANAQDGPTVVVEPATGLADGDTVSVTVSGFPAESTSFQSGQCVTPLVDFLQQCDVTNIVPVPLDADGAASFEITVKEGAIGDGMCGEGEVQCVIVVGSLTEEQVGFAPILFGADEPPTEEAPEEPPTEEEAPEEPAEEEAATTAQEELPETGPGGVATTLVFAFATIGAGLIVLGGSRRSRRLDA